MNVYKFIGVDLS